MRQGRPGTAGVTLEGQLKRDAGEVERLGEDPGRPVGPPYQVGLAGEAC
ncbi:hypothetical protein GCM10020254_80370 [Streptomyces goshikiensis]